MEHDTTNRCINISHIVEIKFGLPLNLIYSQGGYSIRHFLVEIFLLSLVLLCQGVKLRVLEESPYVK